MLSKLAKIKKFLHITGTQTGEYELKEIKQIMIIAMIGIMIGLQIVGAYLFAREMGWVKSSIDAKYDRNIAVLHIDQEITMPYINRIIGQLEKIKEENRKHPNKFPRLLVIVSSPGGSPVGSSELNHYLIEFQKTMPITMYVQEMAVSGSYYIAVSSKYNPNDKLSGIISSDAGIIGSIGVIMPHMVFKGTADKLGVEEDDIAVGKYKKPISMFKASTDEDKEYLHKNLLDPTYQLFLKAVATGRGMSIDEVKKYGEGRIFISSNVVGTLVDRISDIGEVKSELQESIEKKYKGDEVGFALINLSKRDEGLFDVSFKIDGTELTAGLAKKVKEEDNFEMR